MNGAHNRDIPSCGIIKKSVSKRKMKHEHIDKIFFSPA